MKITVFNIELTILTMYISGKTKGAMKMNYTDLKPTNDKTLS